jgi:hypothetical protein
MKNIFCGVFRTAFKISMLRWFFHFHFQVRLANNPYSLEKHSFFEYETHFTVMVCSKHHV